MTLTICLTISTLVVWIRIYVSGFVLKPLKWDDALVLFSWIGMIGYAALTFVTLHYGTFNDIWNLEMDTYRQWVKLVNAGEIMYSVIILAAKLSILLLYLRVFVPARSQKTWVYYAIIFVIIFNIVFYTIATFIRAFSCTPRAKIWDPNLPGTCINHYDIYTIVIVNAGLNVISDVFMILIPMSVIWKLHISRKRKIKISAFFFLGFL